MKIVLTAGVLALAAFTQPAAANPWSDFGGRFELQGQGRQGGGQRPRERELQAPERPDRGGGGRREGRLTEEERRDLRRDIDRANREIYKGRRER